MDRNNMRSTYANSGPRSLPHMSGSKRHNGSSHGNGHNGNGHSGNPHSGSNHSGNGHSGNNHSGNGHNGARLSPPMQSPQGTAHNNNNITNQHDDIINYIFESWNKVTRELERGSEDAKYYQEVMAPRQLANFRPFNLEELWGRRQVHSLIRNKHRS